MLIHISFAFIANMFMINVKVEIYSIFLYIVFIKMLCFT